MAVSLPVRETYSYAVPDHLVSRAGIGRRVLVPFGGRRVIGYILAKEDCDPKKELKEILDLPDQEPLFHESMVNFFQWMSYYYIYPIGRLIQSALPSGINETVYRIGHITDKGRTALDSQPLPPDRREILEWILNNPKKRIPFPLSKINHLEKKSWVIIERREKKSSAGPLLRRFVRKKPGVEIDLILQQRRSCFKAKNEAEFLQIIADSERLLLADLSVMFCNGAYLVKKWEKAEKIESYEAQVVRDPAGKVLTPSPEPEKLFEQQQRALDKICGLLEKNEFSTCLLNGVTGSGKTEVYFQAVRHAIKLDRQAILMVPEIALAMYMEGLFRSRLGDRVAILHSALSQGERYDQWMKIFKGEVDLVIGARSALFAPLPRLGLILVDEEYDFSYKQGEKPRYQARDAAVVRASMEKAVIILGAGTPSIQSIFNTVSDKYHLLTMPDRIEKRPLPEIEIVDMKDAPVIGKKKAVLSNLLKQAIERNLEQERQTILFLNRRGFSHLYLCRSCGSSVRCRNCALSLSYHFHENGLKCHYCDFKTAPPVKCPSCGHDSMRPYGFGTEKLVQELETLFPKARVDRLDSDSTSRKGETYRILKAFSNLETDILVGTQMIAKGYNFPNVTLVGVVAADLSLGFPDFRAGERTYQILTQVAGRAGRGAHKGRVIVQTFNPDHYAITTARDHDYETFFQKELLLRKQLGYPPFSFLATLIFRGNEQKTTASTAQQIGREIRLLLKVWTKRGKEILVLGPVEAPLARLKGKHRFQILIKSKSTELLHFFLNEVEVFSKKHLRKSNINMTIDVDPYHML
ncbi:MAG: primosomal protein N' [Deltaproteobacteria bacterium]|nr:primosomal protein N' [Deltaproteobacteria bacterium]